MVGREACSAQATSRRGKTVEPLALELDEEERQSQAKTAAKADAERLADRGNHGRLSRSRIFVNALNSMVT